MSEISNENACRVLGQAREGIVHFGTDEAAVEFKAACQAGIEALATQPIIIVKLRKLSNTITGTESKTIKVKSTQDAFFNCTPETPCCEREGGYDGKGSGPLAFVCPNHCQCHD